MIRRRTDRSSTRDAGMTLVEMIVTVTATVILVLALSALTIQVLRNQDTAVGNATAAHGTRQLVNYLSSDVRAASPGAIAIAGIDPVTDPCGDTGIVLQIESTRPGGAVGVVSYVIRESDSPSDVALWRIDCGAGNRTMLVVDELDADNPIQFTRLPADPATIRATVRRNNSSDQLLSVTAMVPAP